MVVIKELKHINMNEVSKILQLMRIERMTIFSIDNSSILNTINSVTTNNGSNVTYIEMKPEYFIRFLNQEGTNFSDYNMHSMYIIRGGNFINIKNLFKMINDCYVNIGRGGPQKAHVLSPLDFRLSCYLMALFNFNNNLISSLNTFNDLSKDRYLS
jgi:hypothetical protein